MLPEVLFQFVTAIALSALIGTEREMIEIAHKHKVQLFGGIRTHIILALIGGILTFIDISQGTYLLPIGLVLLGGLLGVNYAHNAFIRKRLGITTTLTGILSFTLGSLCLFGETSLAAILGIGVTIVLVSKKYLGKTLEKIDRKELISTLKFAVVLFVILPILPNETIDPWGVFNPQETWKVVVLISGISYIGYVLSRILGSNKGILLTGVLGGLASSTAVTSSMADQSRSYKKLLYPFVIATIIASSMMFFRVLFWVWTFHAPLVPKVIIPVLFMGTSSALFVCGLVLFMLRGNSKKKKSVEEPVLESPFQIVPALKFGVFFVAIAYLSTFALSTFGESGTYAVSFFAGFADVDAITVTLASQAHAGTISSTIATQGIVIAMITNTLVKLLLAKAFGGKAFGNWILVTFSIILGIGALSLFFI